MGLVTEDNVRALAAFKGPEVPVVSLYLDVDGKRYPRKADYESSLARLVRDRPRIGPSSVGDDLARIDAHVRRGFDRSTTRGLALFSCAAHGLWKSFHLAIPVRNQLVVNHTPHVRQLEAIIHNHERFGVLLADRQRARMFVFEQGELLDRSEHFDQLPRHDDDHGDWDRDHVRGHTAALAHAHLRRAAHVAFVVHQEQSLDHLVVSVPTELGPELERELHAYLRSRIASRLALPASASLAEIRRAAMDVEERIQRTRTSEEVDKLRDRLGRGNGAVAHLDPVLNALNERRVETLLVSDGFVSPGWRCWSCDTAATRGPRCPGCAGEMVRVDDVVEEGVEIALGQACRVVTCVGNADLDVQGRIGALLRF